MNKYHKFLHTFHNKLALFQKNIKIIISQLLKKMKVLQKVKRKINNRKFI